MSTWINMVHINNGILLLYEGDEDLKRHWFICDNILSDINVTNAVKKMDYFIGSL
jgi:hypothetical protein